MAPRELGFTRQELAKPTFRCQLAGQTNQSWRTGVPELYRARDWNDQTQGRLDFRLSCASIWRVFDDFLPHTAFQYQSRCPFARKRKS